MSDITSEVLHNREKYPDDAEITLADGQKVTIGDWRDAVLPKGDLTRASEGWSRKERELNQAVEGLQGQLARAMETRPAEIAPTRNNGQITEEDLLADPVLGPMAKRLQDATTRLTEHEGRLKQHEETWLRANYTSQLGVLGQRFNGRFNKDGKGKAFDQKAFLDYALEQGVSNLDVAYRGFTMDDELAMTTREAEARGEERGIKKGRVPTVPFGRRRGPTRPEGLPGSLQELTDDAVMDDPEMQRAIAGEDES